MNSQELERVLRQFDGARVVRVSDDGKEALLVSPSFEGQDEAERQERIWRFLREKLPEARLYEIRFVFTDAPSEHQDAA